MRPLILNKHVKQQKSKRLSNKGYIALGTCCALLATLFIITSPNIAASLQSDTSEKTASADSQFNVKISYAYVGPNTDSPYFDKSFNRTMVPSSTYASAVRLNITLSPEVKIKNCDAVAEVYVVEIAADTGPTESYAYFIGTAYNPSFTKEGLTKFSQSIVTLIDHRYKAPLGNFNFNWTNTSILTENIGSIGYYKGDLSNNTTSYEGLASAGIPNEISVIVHRIGYVTITNGEPTIFKDVTKNTISSIQLSKYESGFLCNEIIPNAQLPQTDLFHPIQLRAGLPS
jgi:hypothetical protein